jgi:hypothetical protein
MKTLLFPLFILLTFTAKSQATEEFFWLQIGGLINNTFQNLVVKNSDFNAMHIGVGGFITNKSSINFNTSFIVALPFRKKSKIETAYNYVRYSSNEALYGYQFLHYKALRVIAQSGFFYSNTDYNGRYIRTDVSGGLLFPATHTDIYEEFSNTQYGVMCNLKTMVSSSRVGISTNIFTHLGKQPLLGIGVCMHLGYLGNYN